MSAPRPDRPDWHQLPLGDHVLAECPRWDEAGKRLTWVDILGGSVSTARYLDGRWGEVERVAVGRMPTAAQPLDRGALAVAVDGTVRVLAPGGATTSTVVVCPETRTVRTNDMIVDPAGRLLVGLFTEDRVSARGGVVAVDLEQGSVFPLVQGYVTANGLAVTPDGQNLYAVDTARGILRRHRLDRHHGPAVGAETGTVLAEHAGPGLLDGITVGPDGDVWVAVWDAGVLHRYTSCGRLRAVVSVPVARPSALAVVTNGAAWQLVVTTARSHPPLVSETDGTFLEPDPEGRLYAMPLPD